MQTQFTAAQEIELFDADGNSLRKKFKGIANAENQKQVFSVVSPAYKISQHEEVIQKTREAIQDLGLKADIKCKELNDGGRIHMEMIFPDLTIKINENDSCALRVTLDNSYDSTSGLRLNIGAFRLVCSNGLYVGEKFATYYHRHTKGLNVNELELKIEKGVELFQTKLAAQFNQMAQTQVDPSRVNAWLEKCIEDKIISAKYLKLMQDNLRRGGNADIKHMSQVNNQWMVYNLITEVLSHNELSVDRQRSLTETMATKLNRSMKELTPLNQVA